MCGIVGVLSDKKAGKLCYDALEKLEYRGYDSSGIAGIVSKNIKVFKKQGRVQNIKAFCESFVSDVAIAHTRWATHGKVSEENAHPHLSSDGKIAIVHNGIIENYAFLKNCLLEKGVKFKSETDTEVACELVAHQTGSLLEKVFKACKRMIGSYAFAVIEKPHKCLVLAKNKSPLYIAKSSSGVFATSDLVCVLSNKFKFYAMKDGEFAKITKHSVKVFDKNLKQIKIKFEEVNEDKSKIELGEYGTFMEKEINETPAVIKRICSEFMDISKLQNVLKMFENINKIRLVACGTAYHACLFGAKVLQNATNVGSGAEIASEFRYDNPIIDSNTLSIFVSQSGETADTLRALELCKSKGAKTLAITNNVSSSLAFMADNVVYVSAGKEIAVASTKAYIAQILVLYIIAKYLEDKSFDVSSLEHIEELCKKMINIDDDIVQMVVSSPRVFFIGRQLDLVTSLESALKLKEITYKSAEGYSAGELKHGSIALIEKDIPVFVFLTDKNTIEKTLANAEEVRARGAKIVLVAPEGTDTCECDYKIELPSGLETELYNILSILPMQLLALKVTLALGYDPDKPRNLAKSVTVE